ncbi:MAG TPA: type 4a pilus biogenesis protein PilO [Verrucomicrobiae bacterium]|jgi:Tfp pilus assembly protein PilO
MKGFFAQLRPMERRLAVAVLVVVILVLNWWYIWPHFSDWSNLHRQLDDGRQKLALYQKTIDGASKYDAMVKALENQGDSVPVQDQTINFLRTIQSEASSSGAGWVGMGRTIARTNEFFVEQSQSIDVTGNDKQLVDFLYKLGSTASMIRVLDLELQPDSSKMRLNAHVQLVASYQKNPAAPSAPAATNKVKKPQVASSKPPTAATLPRPQIQPPHLKKP